MISVILVDDDVEMLSGLDSLICWGDYGFRIVGKAKNGFEALKLVESHTPDVIITDITMPVMGGLELLREAKKLNPEIKCVIISCHEDFDYAREAIQLEADEYLIKHTITEEGLIRTVQSLKDKIEKKKGRQEELSLAIRGLNSNRYAITDKLYSDIVDGNILSGIQAAEQASMTSIPLPPSHYRIIAFFVDDAEESGQIADKYGSFEYCICNSIENTLCDRNKFVLFPFGKDSFVLLVWDDESLGGITDPLIARLQEVQQNIKSILEVTLSICVGGCYDSVIRLKDAIAGAEKLRTAYFYGGSGVVITKLRAYPLADLSAVYREFAPKMKQKNEAKLMAISRDLLGRDYEQYEPSAVKTLFSRLLLETASAYDDVWSADIPLISGHTFDLCKTMFEDAVRHISENTAGIGTPHSSIMQALGYIDAHLGEEISCEGVAAYINMNASYFSRLFKREMQANFSDYLLYKRIQAATGLLRHSCLSVDEIASVVGIESVSYFYRAYKRITGNTPGVVRGGSGR